MLKQNVIAIAAAAWIAAAAPALAEGRTASVNGLTMYYEVHGAGRPLVLLHGGLCTIESCFGKLLPALAKGRQVIAMEQQAHGHTADVARPLTYEQMAEDTAALLRQLNITDADFLGYSIGGGIALQIAIRHPDLVRKLVLAAPAASREGLYPHVLEQIETLRPENLAGSPWHEAYMKVAPNPANWPVLIEKVKQLTRDFVGRPIETIRAIKAPALVIIGDADIVRPEHAVQLVRLLGGGVAGDDVSGRPHIPRSQLAVLPGTTHVTLIDRVDWLLPMVGEFLDAPMPQADPSPGK